MDNPKISFSNWIWQLFLFG